MSAAKAVNNIFRKIGVKRGKKAVPRQNDSILTVEEVCARLKERGGYTGSYEDLVKHVKMFFNEMSYQLSDGFAVNAGYFSVHPVVDEAGSPFKTRTFLRRLARSIVIDVQEKTNRGYIKYFTDTGTGMVNERITPGSVFIAAGSKIKVEGDDPDCGVWFASMVDASLRFKVSSPLEENTSEKVSGVIPIIPAGKYTIEIKTQYADGVMLKEPRTIKGGFALRNYKILSVKDEETGKNGSA
jgi:type IV secretory pathway protease TraF